MHVIGNNINPMSSSFAGSPSGTTVTLNPGSYQVTEDIPPTSSAQLKLKQHFSADCNGSIRTAGESKNCSVLNEYTEKQYVFARKWGSFGTTDNGQFNEPFGVAVNPNMGEVFVADTDNDRVQKFDSNGNFITKWGSFGAGDGQFNTPRRIAVNPTTGEVFVDDTGNNRIQFAFDP
jgi:DNA-binding beta-propeller fold protein YncE